LSLAEKWTGLRNTGLLNLHRCCRRSSRFITLHQHDPQITNTALVFTLMSRVENHFMNSTFFTVSATITGNYVFLNVFIFL